MTSSFSSATNLQITASSIMRALGDAIDTEHDRLRNRRVTGPPAKSVFIFKAASLWTRRARVWDWDDS
jgi:hypothetical protein